MMQTYFDMLIVGPTVEPLLRRFRTYSPPKVAGVKAVTATPNDSARE